MLIKNKKSKNIWRSSKLISILNEHIIMYPTPRNLNYFWGFGSLAGICLLIQIVSGIFLAMHYVPQVDLAFSSIEHIMRDVPNGWLIRYIHSNGASIFFIVVYIHMARGIYYGSFLSPRHHLWISGVIIFILMMATAFLGYVLPWGQMSFWGATVITNLFSAIPFVGDHIAYFLWGGFGVDNPTLNRFFSLHYFLPFVILGFVGLHLLLLHSVGSSNPLGLSYYQDKIPFYPYFYLKDLFGLTLLLMVFCILIAFYPNLLGHPDNYIPANPLVTPAHIVPEWYFLPFYAILRSIPNKLGGVLCMGLSIGVLFFLPSKIVSEGELEELYEVPVYNPRYLYFEIVFWLFIFNTIALGWIGTCPMVYPYLGIGKLFTFLYFYFLYLIRYVTIIYIIMLNDDTLDDLLRKNGIPIVIVDEDGNPIVYDDEDGNPMIYKEVFELDEKGVLTKYLEKINI